MRTGGEVRSQTHAVGRPEASRRPLLVIDGDSFAHRSYHALPKTLRRSDGKGVGAIVGFANFLLRLYADERYGVGSKQVPDFIALKGDLRPFHAASLRDPHGPGSER